MLHHPNVVQAYDVGESDGTLFLVLEYVDGPSLGRLMRALRTPSGRSRRRSRPISRSRCAGPSTTCTRLRDSDGAPLNVIHRDVTPSNIVLTSTGSLKLLDFGIAKYGSSEVADPTSDGQGQAGVSRAGGDRGASASTPGSICSRVGVVLHEMLTLSPLFAADHELAVLHKVLEMPIPRPSETRPDVPPALDAIVMKALQRDPALRYASAAEMARDLDEFVVGARLHVDDVVRFLRESNRSSTRLALRSGGWTAPSVGTMTTEPAARTTKFDLVHRLRMSPPRPVVVRSRKRWSAAERTVKLFVCASCQQVVYFENSQCTRCGHALAYLPERGVLAAIEPVGDEPGGVPRARCRRRGRALSTLRQSDRSRGVQLGRVRGRRSPVLSGLPIERRDSKPRRRPGEGSVAEGGREQASDTLHVAAAWSSRRATRGGPGGAGARRSRSSRTCRARRRS